jgi:hypothetical protein
MKMTTILFFLATLFIGCSVTLNKSHKQNLIDDTFQNDSLSVYFEKEKDNLGSLILRTDTNEILVNFHASFQDSILVYYNNKIVFNDFINNSWDSLRKIHRFIVYDSLRSARFVTIKLMKEKRKIEFELDFNFPELIISRKDSLWKLNYCRSILVRI